MERLIRFRAINLQITQRQLQVRCFCLIRQRIEGVIFHLFRFRIRFWKSKCERPLAGPFEDTEVIPQIAVARDTTLR